MQGLVELPIRHHKNATSFHVRVVSHFIEIQHGCKAHVGAFQQHSLLVMRFGSDPLSYFYFCSGPSCVPLLRCFNVDAKQLLHKRIELGLDGYD